MTTLNAEMKQNPHCRPKCLSVCMCMCVQAHSVPELEQRADYSFLHGCQ